jgi:hypothetical protein
MRKTKQNKITKRSKKIRREVGEVCDFNSLNPSIYSKFGHTYGQLELATWQVFD